MLQRALPQGHGHHGDARAPLPDRAGPSLVADVRARHRSPTRGNPQVVHTIEAEELAAKAGYSRPHTVHCGPGGIFMSNLGGADGADGPGGVALIDHDTFEVTGAWETDRGEQHFAYDVWWHLNEDVADHLGVGDPVDDRGRPQPRGPAWDAGSATTSTSGASPKASCSSGSTWATSTRWCSSCGPLTIPARPGVSSGVVISVEDLSASVWLWHRDGDQLGGQEGDHHPRRARPTSRSCPPALQPFGAVPPLVSDIDLSVDDRWLYVSCWGTGS